MLFERSSADARARSVQAGRGPDRRAAPLAERSSNS